jgi:signal peptidase I
MMEKIPINILKRMIESNCCKIKVNGNSMAPTLLENDVVQIVKANHLAINDVVLYCIEGKYVLHRIVDIFGDFIITKGDNNNFADHVITKDNVLGRLLVNDKVIYSCPKYDIIYNFWNKEDYLEILHYAKLLDLNILNKPSSSFEDGINIAVSQYSTRTLAESKLDLTDQNQRIYVHIGAKISDFPCDGFIMHSDFDLVFRSGTFSSCYLLSKREQFLVLYNEIELLRGRSDG